VRRLKRKCSVCGLKQLTVAWWVGNHLSCKLVRRGFKPWFCFCRSVWGLFEGYYSPADCIRIRCHSFVAFIHQLYRHYKQRKLPNYIKLDMVFLSRCTGSRTSHTDITNWHITVIIVRCSETSSAAYTHNSQIYEYPRATTARMRGSESAVVFPNTFLTMFQLP
jgi:hypothetical protein